MCVNLRIELDVPVCIDTLSDAVFVILLNLTALRCNCYGVRYAFDFLPIHCHVVILGAHVVAVSARSNLVLSTLHMAAVLCI